MESSSSSSSSPSTTTTTAAAVAAGSEPPMHHPSSSSSNVEPSSSSEAAAVTAALLSSLSISPPPSPPPPSSSSRPQMHHHLIPSPSNLIQPPPKPTKQDAMRFTKKVKSRFQHERGTFLYFIDVMSDFLNKDITSEEVQARITLLLAPHPDLLAEFNTFLPDPIQNSIADASIFVKEFEERFKDNPEICNKFFEAIESVCGKIDFTDMSLAASRAANVLKEIAPLLAGHPDLCRLLLTKVFRLKE